jgi:transforming growth factor-beta-induced protein
MRTRPTTTSALAVIVALGVVVAATPKFSEAGTEGVDESTSVPSSDPVVTATPTGGPQGPFCASIPPEGEGSFEGMADDPVATAASNNPYLTTLTSAVQAAGLVDSLNGEGPFTVLAPNNEAFAAIPLADLDAILANTEQLTSILTYHVVSGASLSAADLAAAGSAVSIQGGELTFTTGADGLLSINGGAATITCSNITTANATVHVIDTVLSPPVAELVDSL